MNSNLSYIHIVDYDFSSSWLDNTEESQSKRTFSGSYEVYEYKKE